MNDEFDGDAEKEALRAVLGPRVKAARKKAKLTQNRVGELVGVTGEFFARIERGHSLPSVRTLTGIAQVLDVSVDYLLGVGDAEVEKSRQRPRAQNQKLKRTAAHILSRAKGDRELTRLLLATLKLFEERAENTRPTDENPTNEETPEDS